MLALALLLSTSVLAATAGHPDTASVVPRMQALTLEIDPLRHDWSGSLAAPLGVRRAERYLALRLAAPASRVEVWNARGRLPLTYGVPGGDSLLVELAQPLQPGSAALNVSFLGQLVPRGPGVVSGPGATARLDPRAGAAVPLWPAGTPATPWKLTVHVPAGYDVISNLPLTGITRQQSWRTWSYASRGALPAESLRVEVRPSAPRAAKPGGAARKGPPRR